ncbi:MAG: hypothetical protein UY23_C0002G0005 [Candidatus Jorgensenbacteria bacterium GW2011_GWA1_48_11]|uniref:Cohesin domain-containing protein n=1 Tax=Candidatus Jorgensenbacteria bacterium GW2011_GWA1_48_11 TaxID=1618660 RepID=A0A0G1UAR4_9BACT|nr:MAG: hypothetical protein UY23_C0002G0005 [Candidatus Jorgensenbacteria bacterium GW2011_GWA1_48_11]KKW12704.1 MAG: hypothetical protein UY51_C0001G0004 [Candidatus Jorgensenbacteria bacterium GW2011_GWB1_49_9]
MNRILKIGIVFASIAIGLGFSVGIRAASGPMVYFKSDALNVAPDSEFRVTVLAGSPETINALNLQIGYSADVAELKYVDTKNSLVSFWQDSPRVLSPGILKLEGAASPPFFEGDNGEVASLVFRAIKSGVLNLRLASGNFYLADGQGTAVKPVGRSFQVEISAAGELVTAAIPRDATPPELQIQTTNLTDVKTPLIVFNVQDRESGVNYVAMRSIDWFRWNDWQIVINPVLSPVGAWAIQFQAVNRQNESVFRTIYLWPEISKKSILIFGGLVLLIILVFMFYNKHKRRRL